MSCAASINDDGMRSRLCQVPSCDHCRMDIKHQNTSLCICVRSRLCQLPRCDRSAEDIKRLVMHDKTHYLSIKNKEQSPAS